MQVIIKRLRCSHDSTPFYYALEVDGRILQMPGYCYPKKEVVNEKYPNMTWHDPDDEAALDMLSHIAWMIKTV